jgi:sialic acid synthase SpsE
VKVIAEIGSNWKTLNDCHTSIERAKQSGADFVKFQLFTPASLYGPQEKFSIDDIGKCPYLHPHWIPALASQAQTLGIEFLCSAFSPREYELVNPYVNYHKIASAELTDITILRMVNSFKKPVFLSTGGSSLEDIRLALAYLRDCDVTIMYCVADYPARLVDFTYFQKMQFTFGDEYDYGYSDHSLDLLNIPVLARDRGASIIEKHVNFCGAVDTPDSPHSCSSDEFKILVSNLRSTNLNSELLFESQSKEMRRLWRRRFIATASIAPGEKLKMNQNIGIYRSKKAADDPVQTFRHWDIDGRKALTALNPGDVICYHNINEQDPLDERS